MIDERDLGLSGSMGYDMRPRIDESPTSWQKLMRLCYIPRWGIVPLIRPQSVAEHTFRVAVISDAIAMKVGLDGEMVSKVASKALLHDMDEALSGDIPASYKDPSPAASDICSVIVKIADTFEAYDYLRRWGLKTDRRQYILDRLLKQVRAEAEFLCGAFPDKDIGIVLLFVLDNVFGE